MTVQEMMKHYRNDGSCEGIIREALKAYLETHTAPVDPNYCGGHNFVWRWDCLDCSICGRTHPQGFDGWKAPEKGVAG